MNGPHSRIPVPELNELARKWAAGDAEPAAQAEIERLISSGDDAELRAAMFPPLDFGTAGLRGEVGPGPARMNLSTVTLVSWALGEFLKQGKTDDSFVVLGYDARPDSERFARHAAGVIAGCGVRVILGEEPLPTPVIAYAVRKLNASAGVVVTASHNPRGHNGYKVFDGDGVQIVEPWDAKIAILLGRAPPAREIPLSLDGIQSLEPGLMKSYFDDIDQAARQVVPALPAQGAPLRVAYTPLHGLGLKAATRALMPLAERVELSTVGIQAEPNGAFPTVPFPNPEEDGALEELFSLARELRCDVACANDPDVDRFALCLPLGGNELVRLSGDALGLLFADACLRTTDVRNAEIISTVVSSPAIELLAEGYGARVVRTLTGFKWLCHAALEAENFLFAYEEALGYCFAPAPGRLSAMDKDGVLALSIAARLLVEAGSGQELGDRLLSIYQRVGLWGSFGHSNRITGRGARARLATKMDRLRETPPKEVAGFEVTKMIDYREGEETRPWYLASQDLLRFDLRPGPVVEAFGEEITQARVLIRPSGTEMKLKAYVHLCSPLDNKGDYAALHADQAAVAERIARQLLSTDSMIPPSSIGRGQAVML